TLLPCTTLFRSDAEEKPKGAEKRGEQKPKTEASGDLTVPVPDIGDFKEVEVIELLVKPGDTVSKEQSLITLESDKATMEIPSPAAGVVKEIRVKIGDKVSRDTPILVLKSKDQALAEAPKPAAPQPTLLAGSRFREVRPGRGEAAVAHPEAVRALPAPQLDLDPARHAVRRGRHHRPRGVSQGADCRDREAGFQAHDAGFHDQG